MNRPLPQIYCNRRQCYRVQTWTGQTHCKSCGEKLNEWSVKSQLEAKHAPQKEPRRRYVLAPHHHTGRPAVVEAQGVRELVEVRVVRSA